MKGTREPAHHALALAHQDALGGTEALDPCGDDLVDYLRRVGPAVYAVGLGAVTLIGLDTAEAPPDQRVTTLVTVGDERIVPEKVEAGTGFFETRFVRREIAPEMAAITLAKPDKGLAFGGVHWQYLDDIANVPAAGREERCTRFTSSGSDMPACDF